MPPAPALSPLAEPVADESPSGIVASALQRVSRFLVSSSGTDIGEVLRLIGESFHADSVSLVAAPAAPDAEDPPAVPAAPTDLLDQVVTWTREAGTTRQTVGPAAPDAGGPVPWLPAAEAGADEGRHALAVPLLTEDERLVGYLGVERSPDGREPHAAYERALSVIGDVLGTHLSRLAIEEARAQTEERWRQLVDRHPDPTLVLVRGNVAYANAAAAVLLHAPAPDALVGRPFEDFISAEEAGRIAGARDAQLQTATPVPFEHVVIRADGDERVVESVSVPFPGTVGGVQTVLRDVTERKTSEDRYRTFIQAIAEGVWRVRLDQPVSRQASARAQADHVLQHGRLAELNPTMYEILGGTHRQTVGLALGHVVGPYSRGLVRALVASDYNLRAYEITTHEPGGVRHFSMNAVGRFERDLLVEIWGSCTEITERVEMERRLVNVLEDQQERIGRDLHDSVGQLLTGVRMLSEGLARRAEGGPEEETAARIAAYSAEALDRVRAICHGLVPPQLYSEGAAGALAELVEHVDALGAARCVFRRDPATDLSDPAAALQAYRVAQEAISNALRHSGAGVIWVYLGRDEDDVVVEIEDDGVGFELSADRARSIGLYGMSRRASSVGASLAIETAPGAGTTVRLTFPNAARAPAETS
ncbi:PAS domain-containing sensor histidine kinase [Rubrivirga sp.]|uniref:PAS domain-containing sensor histidine kinase n=1 Tax=Rubrivirga sp. TaxID=1885344 RepID=UPI003B52C982